MYRFSLSKCRYPTVYRTLLVSLSDPLTRSILPLNAPDACVSSILLWDLLPRDISTTVRYDTHEIGCTPGHASNCLPPVTHSTYDGRVAWLVHSMVYLTLNASDRRTRPIGGNGAPLPPYLRHHRKKYLSKIRCIHFIIL